MTGFVPVPFIFGRARIDGRPVVVAGDDFTVRGGSADVAGKRKQEVAEQMANELRLPIIRLIDGSGGGGSVKTYEQSGFTYVPANPAWDTCKSRSNNPSLKRPICSAAPEQNCGS
jgi:propionyl-CoA carboxylase beta chain